MIYRSFSLFRFKGVHDVSVSLVKGDLVLLLGLNESGKTTILRGIESFDYRNDPDSDHRELFLRSVRNKSDLYSNDPAIVSAEIDLEGGLSSKNTKAVLTQLERHDRPLAEAFLREVASQETVSVQRIFPFKDGKPQPAHYTIATDHPIAQQPKLIHQVATQLISLCPFIIYFEDFTDRIPERIFVAASNDAFNPDWYDIIDGLFFNTDEEYSVAAFKALHSTQKPRLDDAKTVLRRVNKTLNRVFTRKWEELSGVSDIDETELIYRPSRSPYFEIKVADTDGTTYSVDERSKGALWYLSFLMKTEFRRKKIRKDAGKPIFLIDEPASNLHSTAQQNMLGDFRKLVEDTSVIYTTHSQYLVSLDNIKNTYVIRRQSGKVSAVLWADYLRQEAPVISHYQPLANLLQIVPNSLDIPWPRAIITEGVSDKDVLDLMHRILNGAVGDHVVYPGTNAFNLGTLISLNLGWGAEFRILLDDDNAGQEAAEKYRKEFDLESDKIVHVPIKGKKMEDCFSGAERDNLFRLAFGRGPEGKVSKNQFRSTFALLARRPDMDKNIKAKLSTTTLERFRALFSMLSFS